MSVAGDTKRERSAPAYRTSCDACGLAVDPLRAAHVAHIAGRFRYYCSLECFDRRHQARIDRGSALPSEVNAPLPPMDRPSLDEMADMLGLSRASITPEVRATAERRSDEPAHDEARLQRRLDSLVGGPLRDAQTIVGICAVALLAGLTARFVTVLGEMARMTLGAIVLLATLPLAVRELVRARSQPELPSVFVWLAPHAAVAGMIVHAFFSPADRRADVLAEAALLASLLPITFRLAVELLGAAHERVAALARRVPTRAKLARGAAFESRSAAEVRAGEEIEVAEDSLVPVDGVVRSGEALVRLDDSDRPLALRGAGDAILAGARVVQGSLRILTTRAGDDVAIARLASVLGSSVGRRGSARWIARAMAWLPIALVGIAACGAVAQRWNGVRLPWVAFILALFAAPLGVIATVARVPFADALARAGRRSIIYRDLESIESAASVASALFCVRGTVTSGRLEVTDVVPIGPRTEGEIIALVAAVEDVAPDQPFARAMGLLAAERKIALAPVRRPTMLTGRGLSAVDAQGAAILIGSRGLLLSEGVSVAAAEDVAREIEVQQRTAVFVAIGGRVEAVVGFADPLREEARPAVQTLIDEGLDVVLMSGVGRGTLESIGHALDVANVRPEVLPEERASVTRTVSEVAGGVAVIGRSAADGAALGAGDVAISMRSAGAAGSETAIALASDDLRDAADALRIARSAVRRSVRVATVGTLASVIVTGAVAFVPMFGTLAAWTAHLSVALFTLSALRSTEKR